MALYNTFFICMPKELPGGFPGWVLPLPHPVRREVRNPVTKQMMVIETTQPEWPKEEVSAAPTIPQYKITLGGGNYQDYLEGRIPAFIRGKIHWCAKGLTDIELDPLGEIFGLSPVLETALYSKPNSVASLQKIRDDLTAKLSAMEAVETNDVAKSWAARMSAPEFTHSVSGRKLYDGWTVEQALGILHSLKALCQRSESGASLYLLTEV